MPTKVKALQLMESREPLFEKFKVEEQIEHIYGREVPLSNGGSIIIEQTEAMISIDVNSGNYHHSKGQEFIAIKTNVLAANEIARQIRLRDIGGLICIDFIDMRDQRNRKDVEMTLAEAIRPDKARINFLPISEFGILEMTRQRNRQNLLSVNFAKCPVCRGTGTVKSPRTMVLEIFRELKHRLARRRGKKKADGQTTIMVHPKLASFLLNENRTRLIDFEREHNQTIHVQASNEVSLNEIKYS